METTLLFVAFGEPRQGEDVSALHDICIRYDYEYQWYVMLEWPMPKPRGTALVKAALHVPIRA